MTPERAKIAKCMVFCVNHADCAEEVVGALMLSVGVNYVKLKHLFISCFVEAKS